MSQNHPIPKIRLAGQRPEQGERGCVIATCGPLLVALWLCLPFGFGQAADAEPLMELSIKELSELTVDTVFAASKFSQKVTEAPSSVSIVTRDDIRHLGYRTLSDVVRGVRGFDVTYDRNYSYTGVRGFNSLGDYGSRTLLLVDGHRMNDPVYDTTALGTDGFLDVDLIERVEFVRGPGSAIYGSNAFFGVINIVTRSGKDINGVEASASGGSLGTYRGRITLGNQLKNGVEYLFSASAYSSEGARSLYYREFDSPLNNHGLAVNQDGDQFWSGLGKVSFGDFTLQGGYVTRDKDVPTASYGSVFNMSNNTVDSRGYGELRYSKLIANAWSVSAKVFYDTYSFREQYKFSGDSGITPNSDSSKAHWWGGEASVSRTFFEKLRLALGTEFRKSTTLGLLNYDEQPYKRYLDVQTDQMVIGTYLDAHWEISKKLSLSSGVRWDHYNSFGDTINPRGAVIFTPRENTTFKMLYGEAFRAPNIYQLGYSAIEQHDNPDLKPEKIRTYELVAEQYFDKRWRAGASLFRNEISGLIDTTDDSEGYRIFSNTGDATVNGAEAEIEGKWDNGMLARASYTFQDARGGMSGGQLVNSPRNMFKTQISMPVIGDKLSAGVELLYASDRLTLAHNHTGDAWLMNVTLMSAQIAQGLDLSVSLYNVLGQKYGIPGGEEHTQDTLKQDGRTFLVKLTYQF